MPERTSTHIICIVPRLGASVGGGKINAVFRRMCLLADRPDTQVTLLNLQHDCNQKIAFAELVAQGVLDQRIAHRSLYDICVPDQPASEGPDIALPEWDEQTSSMGAKLRITYARDGVPVMRDSITPSAAGRLTIRQILTDPDKDIRLKYLDQSLVEARIRSGDGMVDKIAYVEGEARCVIRRETRAFVHVEDFGMGQTFTDEVAHQRALVLRYFPQDCIVFIDGVTSAHLSRPITARKVLFLHADHRDAAGKVVPRSRGLIEAFDGEAIITATHVHKRQLERDTSPSAPIYVIPHVVDAAPATKGPRHHICTVSRLDLTGKPIHHCIEAFVRVMHLIPGTNYLIYGSGIGQARLQQLIDHHDCGDRVKLMGHTSDAPGVFDRSLLSLAPTMTEGFGLALLEALNAGCPVISYDVDYGPRELITPGRNGELVTPGDIDAIAQAILRVHANHEQYAAACPASVESYSFDAYKTRYFRLIDDLNANRFSFDIGAPDLKAEALAALERAPGRHRERLLDLYIHLCHLSRDLGGMYDGFLEKHQRSPDDQRPLVRCIWLSRRLGQQDACRGHLRDFAHAFPDAHAQFLRRYPEFLDLSETAQNSG